MPNFHQATNELKFSRKLQGGGMPVAHKQRGNRPGVRSDAELKDVAWRAASSRTRAFILRPALFILITGIKDQK